LLPPGSADRIKNLLPRALFPECPGLFVVLPRGRRMVLGSFSGNVKKGATVFTASLQALCKGPARPPKFYLHFALPWSKKCCRRNTIEPFPRKTQTQHKLLPGGCPARFGGKYYEKDHTSFVPGRLRHRGSRCCPDRLRRLCFFCFHHRFFRGFCRFFHCREGSWHPQRQCGHRRFHFHEERHRCPDRRLCRGGAGRYRQL